MLSKRKLPLPAPGPLTVRHVGAGTWAVYDRLGQRVTRLRNIKMLAEADRDQLVVETGRKPRACLCCGSGFDSEGKHHRLCDRCRKLDSGPVPVSWARPSRQREGARA